MVCFFFCFIPFTIDFTFKGLMFPSGTNENILEFVSKSYEFTFIIWFDYLEFWKIIQMMENPFYLVTLSSDALNGFFISFFCQDQYKFVYDTLEEHIVCGKTWFSVSELSERLKAKAAKDPTTKMNQYQKEYAQICKQTPRYIKIQHQIDKYKYLKRKFNFHNFFWFFFRFTIGDCAGGHRADNREKNRDVLCVPRKLLFSLYTKHIKYKIYSFYHTQNERFFFFDFLFLADNFRPYLTSFQGNAFTDYINAVFVDVSWWSYLIVYCV